MTNVTGEGSSHFAISLIPELLSSFNDWSIDIYIPSKGKLKDRLVENNIKCLKIYYRWIGNSLSRLLECVFLGQYKFKADHIFVFGDLPIAGIKNQTLFLQKFTLTQKYNLQNDGFKNIIQKYIFKSNLKFVDNIIVQTKHMESEMRLNFKDYRGAIHVMRQPLPEWINILDNKNSRAKIFRDKIILFYPATYYKHKNHHLLEGIKFDKNKNWGIGKIILTIDKKKLNNLVNWIVCVGRLCESKIIQNYLNADALLFLSKEESYGFPLIEAMKFELPIICPDLSYAREICGDEAIYFKVDDIDSLYNAITELRVRLNNGWRPSWEKYIDLVPKNWSDNSNKIRKIICGEN